MNMMKRSNHLSKEFKCEFYCKIKCGKCVGEGFFVEGLKGNPNQSVSRHLPKLPPPFFQTP